MDNQLCIVEDECDCRVGFKMVLNSLSQNLDWKSCFAFYWIILDNILSLFELEKANGTGHIKWVLKVQSMIPALGLLWHTQKVQKVVDSPKVGIILTIWVFLSLSLSISVLLKIWEGKQWFPPSYKNVIYVEMIPFVRFIEENVQGCSDSSWPSALRNKGNPYSGEL